MTDNLLSWIGAGLLLLIFIGVTYYALRHEPVREDVTLKAFPICVVCEKEVTQKTAGATVPMQVGKLPLVAIYCKDHAL